MMALLLHRFDATSDGLNVCRYFALRNANGAALADGLATAHARGVMRRDLKIANKFNGDGAVKKQGFIRISYPVGRRESYAYEI